MCGVCVTNNFHCLFVLHYIFIPFIRFTDPDMEEVESENACSSSSSLVTLNNDPMNNEYAKLFSENNSMTINDVSFHNKSLCTWYLVIPLITTYPSDNFKG